MLFRPVSIVLITALSATLVFSQTNKAMLDGTKVPPPPALDPPKTPLSPEMRGDIFMARKMYREAVESFSEGSPKDPVLKNKTGIAFHQLLQLDNARKNYELAVKLKPDYAEAINNLGTVYYARKSFRRAIGYYKKALKLSPESASIYSNLGTAYFARRQYAAA